MAKFDAHQKLNVSLNVFSDEPLTEDEKNNLIHRLIHDFDGVQDPAGGTIVIPVIREDGLTVQLWIHEWE